MCNKKLSVVRVINKCFVLFFALFTISIVTNAQIQSNASGNWSDGGTWVGGVAPVSGDDIEIISGHAITLTSDAEVDDIVLTDGSISVGANIFTITGDLTGAALDNITTTSNSELVINDSRTKSQFTFPANITTLKKLTLNRASGATSDHDIDLDDNVPADSIVLVLTDGILYMTGGARVLLNAKNIQKEIPCNASAHVDGIVSRNIAKNAGVFTFPLGDAGICRQFGIGHQNGNTDNISEVQFVYATPVNNTFVNTGFLPGGVNQDFYWNHQKITGANPQRRIYYEDGDFPGLTSAERIASLTLANNDGTFESEWSKSTTGYTVYDGVGQKYVQFDGANASNSEYWTFGSTEASAPIDGTAPLPIELVEFTAHKDQDNVVIKWKTATEINNDFFTLLKSNDGVDFYEIAEIEGSGNSNSLIEYGYVDSYVEEGSTYYMLKQTDYDGKFELSDIIYYSNSSVGGSDCEFKVIPNPCVGNCKFILKECDEIDGKISFTVFDALGNEVNASMPMDMNDGNIQYDFSPNNNLKPGVFIIRAGNDSDTKTERVIIK